MKATAWQNEIKITRLYICFISLMYMTNVHIIYCKAVVLAPHSALRDIDWNKKMKRGVEYRTEGTKMEK